MIAFSEQDRERIRTAVTLAERETRGEIVPMIVPASARYRDAQYRSGCGAAFLALTILVTGEAQFAAWGWHAANAGWMLLVVLLTFGLGYWAGRVPHVIRLVISKERMAWKVRLRAETAFYHHGLHQTQLHTGILILVSLLEHRVQVLADHAIHSRVPPGTWDEVVHTIIRGIKAGQPTDAICQGVEQCGVILRKACPVQGRDNPNELPNDLVQES